MTEHQLEALLAYIDARIEEHASPHIENRRRVNELRAELIAAIREANRNG